MELDARAGSADRTHGVGPPVRPRHRDDPARPRARARPEGLHLADDLGRRSCRCTATAAARVHCGTVDMGQGSDTAMAQMAREVLGIATESVRVVHPDTDVDAVRHGHARVALDVSHGPRRAAGRRGRRARSCCESPASALGVDPADLECRDAAVVCGDGARLTHPRGHAGALRHAGRQPSSASGHTRRPTRSRTPRPASRRISRPSGCSAARAPRSPSTCETGRITVTKLVNVADVGRAINPSSVERQLIGRGHHAGRVHALRGNDLQRRAGAERQPRRLQDPGTSRSARRICRRPTLRFRTRTARSARKGSAKRACSARRRRSQTRCTTRSASSSPICR